MALEVDIRGTGKKLFIGTSGWVYAHWEGIFYPEELPSKDKLKYFSKHFKTAEINYFFYHLPRPSTYRNWYLLTPEDFLFAVKASRFITHIKRLNGVKEAWKQFLENALYLKEKLGPILFQFPPSFKATEENIKRLENFLEVRPLILRRSDLCTDLGKFAFEFRHKSWCDEKIYKLFKKYNVAWVIADSPSYPKAEESTANFVYIRMHAPYINFQRLRRFCSENTGSCITGHGSKVLFASKYTKKELSSSAQKIKNWLTCPEPGRRKTCDVYCYFNNDAYGYAIENARELLKLCV